MKKYGFLFVLAGIIGVLLIVFAIGNRPAPKKPDSQLLGTKYPELARTHIQPGDKHDPYNSNPPSSGPHYSQPAAWGAVDPSKVEPDERYIHNMEHGGIWVTYKPCTADTTQNCLTSAQVDQLKTIAGNLPSDSQFNEQKYVLTPRAANDHAISLVAWTYVYNLDQPDEAQIKQFYLDHVDKGPELIP